MAAITGFGAVSALGRGAGSLWSAMAEGRDGIGPIRRFDPAPIGIDVAAMVPDRNRPGPEPTWRVCVEFGVAAAREAWQQAGLDAVAPHRIAFVFGSSIGDRVVGIHLVAGKIADELGVAGPRLTVSTACTSSTNAIGVGLDLLHLGVADAVIAGGADALSPIVVAGFTALGVLAAGKCAPFSEPPGTSLGEGAGFVVLQREGRARFALLGYGLSLDGFHETSPDPSGAGVARGIRAALRHAGVAPDEIDYVNAHGTGTAQNDPAEWRAIQHVFGPRAGAIPVSSSKSFLGHAQGAAGALETIATLVAMEHGAIPPTQHFTVPRPHSPPDPVGQQTARPARCDLAVSTSSAFGGANCALVIGRGDRALARAPARRPVAIAGFGAIGPHGFGLPAPGAARGRVPAFSLRDAAPTADPRGLDPTTRYLLAGTALALRDAGVRVKGDARERTGLVLGVTVASPESDIALHRTIAERGHRGLSAALFARQVLNAPAGTCAKVLGLRGPHSTLSAGPATGLAAVVYAAELLATRDDCDHVVAAGVDELVPGDPPAGASEGAACVVLAAAGDVRLAGWSVAGPGRLDEAIARARAAAQLPHVDLVIGPGGDVDPEAVAGASPAYTSALGVVIAAARIRAGEARAALVVQTGGGCADCAIVVARGGNHES